MLGQRDTLSRFTSYDNARTRQGAETRDDHPKRVYMVEKRNATNRLRSGHLFEIIVGVCGVLMLIQAVLFLREGYKPITSTEVEQ